MKITLTEKDCFRLTREILSDGSKVFNIEIVDKNGALVAELATDRKTCIKLYDEITTHSWDVE